jgi:NodT family efflux transporter outer membrane factor (OMF) lipoprotein
MAKRWAVGAALVALLAGCANLQPQPGQTQPPTLPARYDPPLAAAPAAAQEARWWAQLQDPQLDALIARALAANRDLKTAAARIAEARALAAVVDARAQPQLSVGGYFNRDRQSENGRFGTLSPNPANERRLGFDASWEIDVFGAIARRQDAARADVQAAAAQGGAVAVSVAGEVAATYVDLRAAQAQRATLRELADAARGIEQLVAAREKAGLATAFDRLRAEQQVMVTVAELPLAQAREQSAARRLGVLVGGDSQTLLAELAPVKPLPASLPALPTAVPAALLERRPDLVAAEAQWRATLARVAAAQADRYPRFSLSGALGLLSISQGNFFDAASAAWSLAAALRAPLYAPELIALVDAERARAEQAALAYESAAIGAALEVEQAALRLQRAQERETQLAAALAADVEALKLARIRYERGLTDFLAVLDVVRSRSQVEQQWVEARAQTFVQYVALNKALGGGWDAATTIALVTTEKTQ